MKFWTCDPLQAETNKNILILLCIFHYSIPFGQVIERFLRKTVDGTVGLQL